MFGKIGPFLPNIGKNAFRARMAEFGAEYRKTVANRRDGKV
jgi:hypothetical protein